MIQLIGEFCQTALLVVGVLILACGFLSAMWTGLDKETWERVERRRRR